MHLNKISISIISFVLLISTFSSNNLFAKVVYTPADAPIVRSFYPKKKCKKKLRNKKIAHKQQVKKIKGKRERAIGMLVGGGLLILLFIIFAILSFLSIGTSALIIYALSALAGLVGGILLIIKGSNNLNRQSKRETLKSNNKGKAIY